MRKLTTQRDIHIYLHNWLNKDLVFLKYSYSFLIMVKLYLIVIVYPFKTKFKLKIKTQKTLFQTYKRLKDSVTIFLNTFKSK